MREATSEPYGPRVYFSIILLSDLRFLQSLFSDLQNQKPKNILLHILFALFICALERSISSIYHYLIYLFTVERLTTSLSRRVTSICCLCVGAAYWVVVILLLVR